METCSQFTPNSPEAEENEFTISFDWDEEARIPVALSIVSTRLPEFYLRVVILDDFPGVLRVKFSCNSWVYPVYAPEMFRIFFSNKVVEKLLFLIHTSTEN